MMESKYKAQESEISAWWNSVNHELPWRKEMLRMSWDHLWEEAKDDLATIYIAATNPKQTHGQP
jgi:hypothetical protein